MRRVAFARSSTPFAFSSRSSCVSAFTRTPFCSVQRDYTSEAANPGFKDPAEYKYHKRPPLAPEEIAEWIKDSLPSQPLFSELEDKIQELKDEYHSKYEKYVNRASKISPTLGKFLANRWYHQPYEELLRAGKEDIVDRYPNTSIEALFGETPQDITPYWRSVPLDAHDYLWKCKVEYLLFEMLKVPREEHAKYRYEYDISQGAQTLEWILPNPPPHHTFEEAPIIKRIGNGPDDHGNDHH